MSTHTAAAARPGVKPLLEPALSGGAVITMWLFVVIPFLALLAAVPVAWGRGLSGADLAIFAVAYLVSGFGATVGFHRHFTHGSFTATRWLRILLAITGSLAVEGSVTQWVADHRRHHAFSDRDGDPHSPWRYGPNTRGLAKGMLYAHVGWLLNREPSNRQRLLAPAAAGGLITGSWQNALTKLFWGGLVRVALLHHVTWSINSICHVVGQRPFHTRDRAANFWPLALLSFGESWHNSHHADPTCARHGVLPGQLDPAARLIWLFERLGWARDVHWPNPHRLAANRATA